MKFFLLLVLILLSPFAQAAPDEELLGKERSYPIQRFGSAFTMFAEEFKVGTFSHMGKVMWPRTINASTSPSALMKAERVPEISYPFDNKTFTLDDFMARQRVTGLLIIKDNNIVVERYQYDRKPDMRFASFSMAKTAVALLIGVALGDGLITSLDDTVEKYSPELKNSAWGQITIRNLLRMSSGVKWNDTVGPGLESDGAKLAAQSFYQRGRGGASAVSWVKESVSPQGVRFNYNSAETFVLGVVLRAAIKRDLSGYLSEKIWHPIGAESDASWLIDYSGLEAGNCCMNATLRDYGRLGMLLANDGSWNGKQLVPRDFVLDATDAERQPDFLKPRKTSQFFGYGYQTWLYPYRTRTFQARGLFGQELIVQPDSKIVIVMTSVLQMPNVTNEIFIERNFFTGSVLKALGGKTDLYR